MKKLPITVLFFLPLLLTGCADAYKTDIPEQPPHDSYTFTIEAIPETETVTPETVEAEQTPRTAKAIDYLYRCIAGGKRPDNFAGAHTVDGTLMIMITDDDQTPYDFMSEFDCVGFERVEYSLKELNEVLNSQPYQILEDHDIIWCEAWVEPIFNAVIITVYDDRYTDEEKAEIASYVENYPVIIRYVDSYQITA